MEALGYTFGRTDEYYAHTTITAPGWKRPIRLDSLGYTREVLDERIRANWDQGVEFYAILRGRIQKWTTMALEDEVNRLEFTIEHSYDTVTILVDTLFLILINVLQMAKDLLSPDLRHEARNIEQYVSDYRFLQREEIHTIPQLEKSIADTAVTSSISRPIPRISRIKPDLITHRRIGSYSRMFTSRLLTGQPLSRYSTLQPKQNAVRRSPIMLPKAFSVICFTAVTVTANCGIIRILSTRIFTFSYVPIMRSTTVELVQAVIMFVPIP